MSLWLRTYADAFAHFQKNFWYEATRCERLDINWIAVNGERAAVDIPDLLRDAKVPVSLTLAITDPGWAELGKHNLYWREDSHHNTRRLIRFLKRNSAAGTITGQLFAYAQEPQLHGFALNDRYFYLSSTEHHGSEMVVVRKEGYEFLMSGQDCEEKIALFRSAFRHLCQRQVWPLDFPDFSQWLTMCARRASQGDVEDYTIVVNRALDWWLMGQLRQPTTTIVMIDLLFAQTSKKRQELLDDPKRVLSWLANLPPASPGALLTDILEEPPRARKKPLEVSAVAEGETKGSFFLKLPNGRWKILTPDEPKEHRDMSWDPLDGFAYLHELLRNADTMIHGDKLVLVSAKGRLERASPEQDQDDSEQGRRGPSLSRKRLASLVSRLKKQATENETALNDSPLMPSERVQAQTQLESIREKLTEAEDKLSQMPSRKDANAAKVQAAIDRALKALKSGNMPELEKELAHCRTRDHNGHFKFTSANPPRKWLLE